MPIRIVTTHLEFEGQVEEKRVVLEGDEPLVWSADAALSVVGRGTPRVDGRERVSGSATYSQDLQLPGMLYAVTLRSPHPHARIKDIDTGEAEAMPGVRAIYTRENAGDVKEPYRGMPILGEELLYAGAEVALVVAETRAQARDAVTRIRVEYEPLPFVVNPELALGPDAPKVSTTFEHNGIPGEYPKTYQRGDVERGLADAEVTIEARFETPTALHNALETPGAVASWDGRTLSVWSSTQDVYGARDQISRALGLEQSQVHVNTQYMGGGFGAKFGAHRSGLLAAFASHRLGRPVHHLMTRTEENLDAGNRPASYQTYRLGARLDGTLTALELRATSSVGALGSWFSPISLPAKELYQCANVRTVDVPARTNLGTQASFRAPGVVEGIAGLEVAIDRLALALGMDPLELRRRNHAERYQLLDQPYAAKTLLQAYDLGAERIGWASRDDPGRRFPEGEHSLLRRGIGMASQLWGGDGGPPAQALVKLLSDGGAIVLTGTQDIGTGTRTSLAQVAAEELGYPLKRVRVELGQTEFGLFSPASGGSMTLASVGPAVRMAAVEARKALLEIVGHLAEAPSDALAVREGRVVNRETGRDMGAVSSFLEQLDGHEVTGKGMRGPNAQDVTVRTFGAQFAEVEVDLGTGQVRVVRVVAAHDCGRIVNPLTWTSQIEGGILQGLGFALFEQRVVDAHLGTVLNPNLGDYKVPTIRDLPEIEIISVGIANERANTLGVLGAGEPPIILTAGAIANAVAHAIERPIEHLPLTPDRVLALIG
jgi:CO/xanthine dehydrogenase Mo-binding subunit